MLISQAKVCSSPEPLTATEPAKLSLRKVPLSVCRVISLSIACGHKKCLGEELEGLRLKLLDGHYSDTLFIFLSGFKHCRHLNLGEPLLDLLDALHQRTIYPRLPLTNSSCPCNGSLEQPTGCRAERGRRAPGEGDHPEPGPLLTRRPRRAGLVSPPRSRAPAWCAAPREAEGEVRSTRLASQPGV